MVVQEDRRMVADTPLRSRLSILSSFRGPSRVLHLTTLAFFLSFVVWFDLAPFATAVRDDLGLTDAQMVTLALCNLALTVPARVVIGALLDRIGPRRLYAGLLIGAAVPNTVFALSSSFPVLVASRLALGVVGAGFVVGIRMVSGWFRDEDLGTAEGIYGGWGNFGSAGAALALPGIASLVAAGAGGWRWGVGIAGLVGAIYGVVYWRAVDDAPTARRVPVRRGGRLASLSVPSRGAVWGLLALQLPVAGALGVVAWRVEAVGVLSTSGLAIALAVVAAYLVWQVRLVLRTNAGVLSGGPPAHDYPFRSVVLLSLAYGITFGAELTVVSLLPTFFADTFGLHIGAASAAGSAFAFTNLVTRPGGGLVSDVTGARRRWVVVALLGTAASFAVLAFLDGSWPLALGVGLVALASVFVQGGNGAVFAMVPLVHPPMSGQIAGLAGSYGNIGGIAFSSLLFLTHNDTQVLFLVLAGAAVVVAAVCRWLPHAATDEPAVAVPSAPAEPVRELVVAAAPAVV
jgi:NNP family nitrate/nitrite transporter-like MFS transporter